MTTTTINCQYCGNNHGTTRCLQVKAIEYGPDGKVTRVEFMTPADYLAPLSGQPMPVGPVTFGGEPERYYPFGNPLWHGNQGMGG